MLIEINSSVLNGVSEDEAAYLALSQLVRSHIAGNNVVISNPSDLIALSDLPVFGSIEKQQITIVARESVENYGLKSILMTYVVIDSIQDSIFCEYKDGVHIIHMPLYHYRDMEKCGSPLLLCENSIDCDFYCNISEAFFYKKKLSKKFQTKLEPRHGGGGTTAAELKRLDQASETCLCIIDSDRSERDGSVGSTARCVLEARCHNGNSVSVILDCKEAENLIPLPLVEEAAAINEEQRKMLEFLFYLYQNEIEDYSFVDIKDGITKKLLRRSYSYMVPHLVNAGIAKNGDLVCDENECQECNGVQCLVLQGLGGGILNQATKALKEMSIQKKAEVCTSSVNKELERIASLVGAWGLALRFRSTMSTPTP